MVAGAGRATPHDAEATERLMHYWADPGQPGYIKIGWGHDGDFDRCVAALGKYVGPGRVKGLCSNLHVRATGARPGHAPAELAERAAKNAAKKASR